MKFSAWTRAVVSGTPAVVVGESELKIFVGENAFFISINDWVELSRAVVAAIDAANEKAGAA